MPKILKEKKKLALIYERNIDIIMWIKMINIGFGIMAGGKSEESTFKNVSVGWVEKFNEWKLKVESLFIIFANLWWRVAVIKLHRFFSGHSKKAQRFLIF